MRPRGIRDKEGKVRPRGIRDKEGESETKRNQGQGGRKIKLRRRVKKQKILRKKRGGMGR